MTPLVITLALRIFPAMAFTSLPSVSRSGPLLSFFLPLGILRMTLAKWLHVQFRAFLLVTTRALRVSLATTLSYLYLSWAMRSTTQMILIIGGLPPNEPAESSLTL